MALRIQEWAYIGKVTPRSRLHAFTASWPTCSVCGIGGSRSRPDEHGLGSCQRCKVCNKEIKRAEEAPDA